MIRLISVTPDAEKTLVYVGRVSSQRQDNPDYVGLVRYLIKHKHWSPFEHAFATFEIITSRMISAQILRHRSFTFQEHSQRYSAVDKYEPYQARRQDDKNRQNSIDDLPDNIKQEWLRRQQSNWELAKANYDWAVQNGVAKECARAVLPMQTRTRIYASGTLRSWIHYLEVRCSPDTQLEHREIALRIRDELKAHVPIIAEALGWI
jgi:thymidylate synthase (FAD)